MNTNKGFAPIIAIIIAVVIIAGGIGGYLYIKNKNTLPIVTPSNTLTTTVVTTTSTVVTTTSTDVTASWKTYTNSDQGYEIKYPSDLVISTPYDKSGQVVEIKGTSRFYNIGVAELSGTSFINGEEKNIKDMSPKELIAMGLSQRCKKSDLSTITWTNIAIGGIVGQEASNSNDQCINSYLPQVAVIKNNFVYYLSFIKGILTEYNQILSTFKFTR